MSTTAPLAAKSISLRRYPHNDLDAPSIVREVCAQAKLAPDGGFDGIMTSEHHGGFAGYMPLPLQMVSFILEDTERDAAQKHRPADQTIHSVDAAEVVPQLRALIGSV